MRPQFLSILALCPLSQAYGAVGHRTIGYLAEKWLTETATQIFTEILANDRGFDFSDAAVWADKIRDRDSLPWNTGPWHFVNNLSDDPPNNICGISWADCPADEGCILSAIVNQVRPPPLPLFLPFPLPLPTNDRSQTQILQNPSLDPILRKNATMFLFHFIGDLHQPLHTVGFDRGGTRTKPVCWDTPSEPCHGGLHLHSVWDRHIIHKQRGIPISLSRPEWVAEKAAAKPWAEELYAQQQDEGVECEKSGRSLEGDVIKWAGEVNKYACEAVYKRGVRWIKEHDLSEEYYEENKELVERLVAKAGLRLGCWLNSIAEVLSSGKEGGVGVHGDL